MNVATVIRSLKRAVIPAAISCAVLAVGTAAVGDFARARTLEGALDAFDRQFTALDQATYARLDAATPYAATAPGRAAEAKTTAALARVSNAIARDASGGWRVRILALIDPIGRADSLEEAYSTYREEARGGFIGIGRDGVARFLEVARRPVLQAEAVLRENSESTMLRALMALAGTCAGLVVAIVVFTFRFDSSADRRSHRQKLSASGANDVVMRLTADGRIAELDGAVERVLGVRADKIAGTTLSALVRPVHADALSQFFAACGANATEAGALEVRAARTGRIWYRIEPSESRRRTDGTTGAMVFRVSDVSARRETEEALRQSSEMLRTLTEASPLAITIEDTRGRIKLWNPACVGMFGWSSEEVVGAANPTVPADRRAGYENLRKQVLQGQAFAVLETERMAQDGRRVQVTVSTAPLRDASGRTWGVMEVVTDITEHKVLSAQLLQSQKMEGIGRLAGGIAHDFNNLLTAILGQAAMLLRSPQVAAAGDTPIDSSGGPSLAEGIEQIKLAAERASHMTSQLLAFSRNQTMQPTIMDLNETIVEMDAMLRPLIGEDVDLVTIPDATPRRVKADPTQITQVLINLVVNARDALTSGGKITIETAAVILDDAYARRRMAVVPGSYVMLAVSDNGHGMDAETQARMFEPFFTTKPRDKGTGLGLATVYGIVKQSGGYIWCYSERGHGTSFKIYFPAVEAAAVSEYADAAPAPTVEELETIVADPQAVTDGAETVLLVEDEEMVRTLVRQVLTWYGYKVLEADNGEAAIRVAEQYSAPIDLLVTDLVMPGMSALEMVQQIVPKRRGIRVLYMSGYTDHAVVRHHLLHRDIPFIQKPFTPDRLAHKVRAVLDGATPTSEQLQAHADAIGIASRAASGA